MSGNGWNDPGADPADAWDKPAPETPETHAAIAEMYLDGSKHGTQGERFERMQYAAVHAQLAIVQQLEAVGKLLTGTLGAEHNVTYHLGSQDLVAEAAIMQELARVRARRGNEEPRTEEIRHMYGAAGLTSCGAETGGSVSRMGGYTGPARATTNNPDRVTCPDCKTKLTTDEKN